MAQKDFPPWILAAVLGALTFAFLHLHFVSSWQELYVSAPRPGFGEAARRGLIDPLFADSSRSLRLTEAVLFALALVTGLTRGRRPWSTAVAVWIGVMLPLVPVLVARSVLSGQKVLTVSAFGQGEIPAIALVYEAVRTGAPIFAGMTCAVVLLWLWHLIFGGSRQ
jgi:hypothetical protein